MERGRFPGTCEIVGGLLPESQARNQLQTALRLAGGDDGGAVGDRIVGKAFRRITNNNLLIKENAEPFGGVVVSAWKGEGASGDVARIIGNRESDGGEV